MKKDREIIYNPFLQIIVVVALGCFVCQTGCVSSSNLVDIWHDSSYKSPPLSKLFVVALRKDAVKRRIGEDAFTNELARKGIAATASYHLFPNAPPDTNQVDSTVQANGFDGIIVILTLPRETSTQFIQGYVISEMDMYHYPYYINYGNNLRDNPYRRRYGSYYHQMRSPGYIDTQKTAIHTVEVSTTGNSGRLIWSATSRTSDPVSVENIQREIAGLIIAKLGERDIVRFRK